MTDPWRDRANYQTGRKVKCYGCGNDCRKTHWGNWCYDCNVKRIDQINGRFRPFAEAIGEPLP